MTTCGRAAPGPVRLPAFDIQLSSDPMAVRAALRDLLDRLEPLDLGVAARGNVELVLAEALNNIVEHAYACRPESGKIAIRCLHLEDSLHLRIFDWGLALPGAQVPVGAPPNSGGDVSGLPEGGFGWFLIHDLARDIRYTRMGNRNRLDLRLPIGP